MYNRLRLVSLVLVLPLTLSACAPRVVSNRGSQSDQLTREMLDQYATVGTAIQVLRSRWLVRRSPVRLNNTPANPVWVYRDGTRFGDVDVLTYLSTSEVLVIDYYNAAEATLRWGTNHENGVIHLTSR